MDVSSFELFGSSGVTQDINVLALVKGKERYVFLFDDEHRSDALRSLGRFASNPELSFSWYDAAVLSQRIRQTSEVVDAHPTVPAPHLHSRPRFKFPLASDTSSEKGSDSGTEPQADDLS